MDYPVVNENDLRLVINNVVQQPGSGKAYTAAASTLTLSAATTTSDTMYAVFLGRALQTVNPPADSVGGTQLADSAISGQTALGAEPADTDEFLVSDAGTLKRVDYSYIKPGSTVWNKLVRKTVTDGDLIIEFDDTTASEWFSSDYRVYKCILSTIEKNTLYGELYMQTSTAGSYTTSGYDYVTQSALSSQAGWQTGVYSESASFMQLTADNIGDAANESSYYEITFDNPLGTTNQKIVAWNGYLCDHNSRMRYELGVGSPDVTSAIDAFKFYNESSHTFKAGTATLYGLTT